MASQTISRIQRNHGLEHATIHMLTARHRNFSAQGNSDHRGFNLNVYGDISQADVETAVYEAHRRMKNGETHLAVHPNCGTVLITTATMATLAAQAVLTVEGRRQPEGRPMLSTVLNSLPMAILAVVMALIVSRPLGIHLQQRYTTDGNLGDLEIVSVEQVSPSIVTRFFHVLLTGGRREYAPQAYRIRTRN